MNTAALFAMIAVALVAAISAVFLRESRMKTTAMLVTLAAGAVILIRLLPYLDELIQTFYALSAASGVNSSYLGLLLKIIGVAYVAEFGAQICRDAGEGAAAMKVELAARVVILLLALPVLTSVVRSILDLLA